MNTRQREHLAIFAPPFIEYILKGEKTVEGRFSKVKCAPFRKVTPGDIVWMKESGGKVKGMFYVKDVETFEQVSSDELEDIRSKYEDSLCTSLSENFWNNKMNSNYVTLLHISNPSQCKPPFSIHKKDKRGWILLNNTISDIVKTEGGR